MQPSDLKSPNPPGSPRAPAEIYDELFVPALFRQWAPALAELSGLCRSQRVLDVACGTGALTCQLPERVGPDGSVVGLDANPEMLRVARTKPERVEWIEASAEALPFGDRSFDAVVSQFGFMFFLDRPAALREMMRVLRPGGSLAVAVWDRIEHCPGYAALEGLLQELFGAALADAFRAPFQLGDPERLLAPCVEAGIADARVTRREGSVRFSSLEALLRTERACVWTLGGMLDDAQFERLLARARPAFQPFVARAGGIEFACPALILSATRP
jgi:SAM-dependent methyltransferase